MSVAVRVAFTLGHQSVYGHDVAEDRERQT